MSDQPAFRIPPRTVSSGTPVDPSRLVRPLGGGPAGRAAGGGPAGRAAGAASTSPSTTPPPARSPQGPAAAAASAGGAGSPPPPPAAPTVASDDEDDRDAPLPEGLNHFVSARQFFALASRSDGVATLPGNVRTLCSKLWPEGEARPDGVWSREDIFSSKERVSKDRKLANMVLGILGRLTPENYDKLKRELFDLPIRQSTDEEITDVVRMMYTKAVRPEDELYTELYARLMADLVQHTGVQGVGKTIRKAIIDKCQQQFEQPFRLSDEEKVDADGEPLPDDEINMRVSGLKAKLRSNIKFLGHIFISGMVNEKVVNFVLFYLLYGREQDPHKKRKPEEYELEMFCDLLKKVVKQLSAKTLDEYVPGYMTSLKNLIPRVGNRIKFLLMDMVELYDNKWVERRRGAPKVDGPVKLNEFDKLQADATAREQKMFEVAAHNRQRGGPPAGSPKTPAPVKEVVPLPRHDLVNDAFEAFRTDSAPAALESFFKPLPQKERLPYVVHWLKKIVKSMRMREQRNNFGEAVEVLRQIGIAPSDLERAVFDLATFIVVERVWEDLDKVWQCWAEIVNSCKSCVTHEAHSFLLRALIRGSDHPTSIEVIVKMVTTVLDANDNKDAHQSHRDPLRRFRPLPAVLQYASRLPDPDIPEEDVDLDEIDDEAADDDLLARIIMDVSSRSTDAGNDNLDPEIAVFDTLTTDIAVPEVTHYVKTHAKRTEPVFAAKVAGAIFTYTRCDTTGSAIDRLKEPLVALVNAAKETNDVMLVAEAFATWLRLGREPRMSFRRFVDRLQQLDVIQAKTVEAAHKLIDARMAKEFAECLGLLTPAARQAQQQQQQSAAPAHTSGATGRRR